MSMRSSWHRQGADRPWWQGEEWTRRPGGAVLRSDALEVRDPTMREPKVEHQLQALGMGAVPPEVGCQGAFPLGEADGAAMYQ